MYARTHGTPLILRCAIVLMIDSVAFGAERSKRDDDGDPRPLIEEIVIEGERAEQVTLKDTSHSITVFTEEDLDLGTDRDMADIFQRVPNVTTDPFTGELVVRGIASDGINRGFRGAVPNTVRFVDGFFTPIDQHLWDANQVEVLRGPESYMSPGYMGGITAVNSNEPGSSREGKLTASWSPEADERRIGVAHGGPISDTLGYRVAAHLRATDGFFDNVTRRDNAWNERDERLLRLKLEWQPQDDTKWSLRGERIENRSNGWNVIIGEADVDPFDRETFDNLPINDDLTSTSANLELRHRFDERWSTSLQALWICAEYVGSGDWDDTAADGGRYRYKFQQNYSAASARLFFESGDWEAFFRQFGVRLDLDPADHHALFPVDFDGDGGLQGVEIDIATFRPTPEWWFVGTQLGLRRDLGRLGVSASIIRSGQTLDGSERSIRSRRVGSTGDPVADAEYDAVFNAFLNGYVSEDLRDYNYLPTLVVDYAFTDNVTIGAKFERTARLAGVWFNVARATTNTYDDEYADSFDVFIRSSWFDGRLSLRANVFYTRISDQQVWVLLSSTPDDGEFRNAKSAHNDGLELQIDWSDGPWKAWLAVGTLHAELDHFEFYEFDFSGNDLPNAPDWTLGAGFLFNHGSGLFLEADITARPETRASLENTPGVINEERTLMNARIGWAFDRVELSVYARNLLDEDYLEFYDPDAANGGVRQSFIVGEPREVGVTISARM